LEVVALLFVRRTSVQPAGGVIAALEFVKPIAAIMTSPATVPVGVGIVRLVFTGLSARMWALPHRRSPPRWRSSRRKQSQLLTLFLRNKRHGPYLDAS